jgi:hypothetical protein
MVTSSLDERRARLDVLKGRARELERFQTEYEQLVQSKFSEAVTVERAAALLSSLVEGEQAQTLTVVEELVTEGLQSIFGPEYEFKMLVDRKRSQVSIDFRLITHWPDRDHVTPLAGARGGGLLAVIGFVLRVVLLSLFKERSRLMLVLDESFGQVSSEYTEPLMHFVKKLIDELGVQVVMVTHDPAWLEVADRAYRFRMSEGQTRVRQEK